MLSAPSGTLTFFPFPICSKQGLLPGIFKALKIFYKLESVNSNAIDCS